MLPQVNAYYPTNRNRNRPRPINPMDSAATTGLLNNPNGTYVSYNANAHYGAQGTFGAMLPQVQVQPQQQNLWNTLFPSAVNPSTDTVNRGNQQLRNLQSLTNPIVDVFQRLTGAKPWWGANVTNPYQIRANQHATAAQQLQEFYANQQNQNPPNPNAAPGAGTQGLPTYDPEVGSQLAYDQYRRTVHGLEQKHIGMTLAKLESGDMSALAGIPAADLEAMGLGEFSQYGLGGGANPASNPSGIGTGIDEGKDMTPSQLEARYWRNQETEAAFLKQKRWDEKKKRYISVGQWMRDENKKYNRKGRRREENRPRPQIQDQRPQYTQSVTADFNTGTG